MCGCAAVTGFSGLTAKDFVSVSTTLEEVQERVLNLVSSDTILLGHSLESDLRALKVRGTPTPSLPPTTSLYPLSLQMIHSRVVDTAIVFPHRKGPPLKRALRNLMKEHLSKFIQDNAGERSMIFIACQRCLLWWVGVVLLRWWA